MVKIMSNTDSGNSIFFEKVWNCLPCKVGLITVAIIVGFFLLVFLLADPLLNSIAKPKIVDAVSDDKTTLELGDLHYSPFDNRISTENFSFVTGDSSDTETNLTIPFLSADGVDWFAILFGGDINFSHIYLDDPSISIITSEGSSARDEKQNSDTTSASLSKEISSLFPKELKKLDLSGVTIKNGSLVRVINRKEGTVTDSIKSFNIEITGLDFESGQQDVLVFLESIEISASGLIKKNDESGYKLSVQNFNLSSKKSNLRIDSLLFMPTISDEEFFSRKTYRGDRWIFNIPSVNISGFDFSSLIRNNHLKISEIIVEQFSINIFTNKRLPLNPQSNPKMPHELLSSLGFDLIIDSIKINNSHLVMQSLVPNVDQRAELTFSNINTTITNISNVKSREKTKPAHLSGSGSLQREGFITLDLLIPLTSDVLNFSYSGNMDEMSATKLNSHLEVENKVSVKSGFIRSIEFESDVYGNTADVKITPLYDDLEINVLGNEGKDKSTIKTFLADLLKIKTSNPLEDEKIRHGNVKYPVTGKDTFLDVIWLAQLKGLGKVVNF